MCTKILHTVEDRGHQPTWLAHLVGESSYILVVRHWYSLPLGGPLSFLSVQW